MEDLHRNLHILTHLLERVIIPESLALDGDISLSQPQYEALFYVQNHPGSHPGDLAKAYGISAPTVTSLLQRLERKGLVYKKPAANDQRAVTLALTSAGVQLLAEVERRRDALLSDLIDKVPFQAQQQLEQGLHALLRAAGRMRDKSQLCLQCGNAHTERCVLAEC